MTETGFESEKILKQLEAQLNSLSDDKRKELVNKVKGIFEIELKNSKNKTLTYTIDMKSNKGSIYQGKAKDSSDAKINMADGDFVSLTDGKLNSQKAFMQGKLKVKGKVTFLIVDDVGY